MSDTVIIVGYFVSLGIMFVCAMILAILFIKSKHGMDGNIPEGIELIIGTIMIIALIAFLVFRELVKRASGN